MSKYTENVSAKRFCLLGNLLVCVLLSGCLSSPAHNVFSISRWHARKPVVLNNKISGWESAPEFFHWKKAHLKPDGLGGKILEVNLTGPFIDGAWSQHAGMLLTLSKNIPAKQTFVVIFKARRVSGGHYLTVLRSWGGAEPWNAIPINSKWKTYTVNLTSHNYPTNTISFSLVNTPNGLQPYCAGSFQLANVVIKMTKEHN